MVRESQWQRNEIILVTILIFESMKSPDFNSMCTVFNTQSHFSYFKNNNNKTCSSFYLVFKLSPFPGTGLYH